MSALSHLLYCERRAALVHVVGVWLENEHTTSGQLLHERIDSGEETSRLGLRVLRSIFVRSERLHLVGVIDAVEVHPGTSRGRFVPIETKRGARRRWIRDDVQLCAQAMGLEEMTATEITEGAIFHHASKRRRVVPFTDDLRRATADAAKRLHALVAAREVPRPVSDERCPSCSLIDPCQPNAFLPAGSLATLLQTVLE
jgi:CRISPR-associated exonuclease Cas4